LCAAAAVRRCCPLEDGCSLAAAVGCCRLLQNRGKQGQGSKARVVPMYVWEGVLEFCPCFLAERICAAFEATIYQHTVWHAHTLLQKTFSTLIASKSRHPPPLIHSKIRPCRPTITAVHEMRNTSHHNTQHATIPHDLGNKGRGAWVGHDFATLTATPAAH